MASFILFPHCVSASWPTVDETETKWVMGEDVPEAGDEYRPGARQAQGTILSALLTLRLLPPFRPLVPTWNMRDLD